MAALSMILANKNSMKGLIIFRFKIVDSNILVEICNLGGGINAK
jgi:hypothetical protein